MRLSALYRYPLKSSAALQAEALEIEPRGPRHDRRWMVVDENGRFLTARVLPEMVRIRAEPDDDGLRLSAPGMDPIAVPLPPRDAPRLSATVWKDTVDAQTVGAAADAWLSDCLGRSARLMYMDAAARRAVDPAYGFADGYPLLLISQAALDDLNTRLVAGGTAPVTMTHFRPNLVVEGAPAHAEDGWRRVRIGALEFDAVKPCTRCVFTTVDPALGRRRDDGQPLEMLKSYRRTGIGITFGMNLVPRGLTPRGTGTLHLHDPVEVLD
jgi:uncharacterized protein YcbX